MSEHPIINLTALLLAAYLANLWYRDYRQQLAGNCHPSSLPGATPVTGFAITLAIFGALLLLAVETTGELALGVADQQSKIAVSMLLLWLSAGIVEEILFRGYLIIEKRGKVPLVASILFFSLLFTLCHTQYWLEQSDSGWLPTGIEFTSKSLWTLAILFLNSLWFYYVRFCCWNPNRSLLPCFAGHIASNFGVFFVKLLQGHVTGFS